MPKILDDVLLRFLSIRSSDICLFLPDWLLKVGEYSSSVKTGTLKPGFEIDYKKKVKQEISSVSTNFKLGILNDFWKGSTQKVLWILGSSSTNPKLDFGYWLHH